MQDKEEYKKGGHNTSQEENEQKSAIFVGQSQLSKEKPERAVTTALSIRELLTTALLIRELLSKSGYPVKNLKVIPLYSPYHKITYDDTTIGVYNYATDSLALSGGDGTYLKEPVAENLRIVRQGDQWQLHPDVKIQLVDRLVPSAEPIDWQEGSSLNNSSQNRRRHRIVL